MARARYFKQYNITWDYPHVDFNPGEPIDMSRGEFVRAMNKKVQALSPLTNVITTRLRKAKQFTEPEITQARSAIGIFEAPYAAVYAFDRNEPLHLYSRFYMNPLKLLELPDDGEVMGNLAIEIAEDFLDTMKHQRHWIANFPSTLSKRRSRISARRITPSHGAANARISRAPN